MSQQTVASDSPQNALQQLRGLRKGTVLGIVIVALLLILLVFALVDRSIQSDVTQAELTLTALDSELIHLQTPAAPVLTMMSTLTTTRALAEQIRLAAPAGGINWPQTIGALEQYDAETIMLTSLTQVDQRISITGQAVNEDVVVAYAQTMEKSNLFAAVVVQSIRMIPAPTATPLATASPPALPAAQSSVSAPPKFLATATNLADFVIIIELD